MLARTQSMGVGVRVTYFQSAGEHRHWPKRPIPCVQRCVILNLLPILTVWWGDEMACAARRTNQRFAKKMQFSSPLILSDTARDFQSQACAPHRICRHIFRSKCVHTYTPGPPGTLPPRTLSEGTKAQCTACLQRRSTAPGNRSCMWAG